MARRRAELDAVVGQYRVDFVRGGFDESDEEGRSGDGIGFLDQLNEGELRRAVDGDQGVKLSLGSLNFGDVDVEEANGIGFEPLLRRLVALEVDKPPGSMPLQAAMRRRSRQVRDGRL
jgi:hypothetical protein